MTVSQIAVVSVPLSRVIRKYNFIGLFRFGKQIKVDLKVCCGNDGNLFYQVINGPQHIDYERIFGEAFQQAKCEVAKLWNISRTQSRSRVFTKTKIQTSPENKKSSIVGKYTPPRRSVDGAIREALVLKNKEVPQLIKKINKVKTAEYSETDISFGDTSKIYGRQTHTFGKTDKNTLIEKLWRNNWLNIRKATDVAKSRTPHKMFIGIELANTVVDCKNGSIYPHVNEAWNYIKTSNYYNIIVSTYFTDDYVTNFLRLVNLKCDWVNTNPCFHTSKPYVDCYIDAASGFHADEWLYVLEMFKISERILSEPSSICLL
jgi:hypothetical protein